MEERANHSQRNHIIKGKFKYLFFLAFILWFFFLFYIFAGRISLSGLERLPLFERVIQVQQEFITLISHLMRSFVVVPLLKKVLQSYAEILFLAAILMSSLFIGHLFAGRFKSQKKLFDLNELLPISAGLGLWVFSLIALLLALSGFLIKGIAVVLILLILILFFVYIEIQRRKYQEAPANISEKEIPFPLKRFLIIMIGLSIFLAFFFSLKPPLHYDALEYHLALPSEMIKNNSLLYFPFDVHSNFPLNVEMMYLLALLISGWKLAGMIHFIFFPLFLILIYTFGKRFFGRNSALIASALFGSTYVIMDLSTHPLVDLAFGFFTMASFILLVLWLKEERDRFLYFSAILTGIALGTKYTAFIFTIPLNFLFVILFTLLKKREAPGRKERLGKEVMKLALYILILLAVASPWLVRNLVNTGNPVFPIAAEWIGWERWTPEQDRLLKNAANASMSFRGVLSLPWRMSFSERDFGSSTFIGPIYLILLPLIFFCRKKKIEYILILYSLLYFLLWGFSFNMMRFAVCLLAVLSLLLGRAITHFSAREKPNFIQAGMSTILVILICTNCIYFVMRQIDFPKSGRVVLGMDQEDRFLSRYVEYYSSIDHFNTHAPEEAKILFVGDPRSFYTERKAVWSSAYDENPIVPIIQRSKTPDDIAESLLSEGFSHLLYAPQGMKILNKKYSAYPFSKEESIRFNHFLRKRAKRLYSYRGAYLFQIQ
jgi:4-amino-4-deoxy-L-arabinose transferase-like glycosyltransferase